jgi:hypothetical protein
MTNAFKKYRNLFLIFLLVSLTASLLLLKFDVGASIEQFERTPNGSFYAPNRTVDNQTLTIRTMPSSDSAGISVEDSRFVTNAINCSNTGLLLCLSVAPQTVNGKQSLLIEAKVAHLDEQKQLFSVHTADTTIDEAHEITLQVSGNWFELHVDDEIQGQRRFGIPIGISIAPERMVIRTFGQNSKGLLGNQFQYSTRQEFVPSIVLFILSLLALMVFFMRYLTNLVTKRLLATNKEMFFQIVVLSSIITFTSWLIVQSSLIRNGSTLPTTGLTFIELPMFSDFFQVWGFSEFTNLYQTQLPDYPPAQIFVFSVLSKGILAESAFLIIVCCSTAALGALIWSNVKNYLSYPIIVSVLLTFTSAPLIFAVNRGGTDMILFPLVVLAVLLHSNGRQKVTKILLSISGALKIVPTIYILMYLGRGKSTKKAIPIIGSIMLMNLLAALVLPEKNISELWFFAKQMVGRSSGSTVTGAYDVFNNSLWSLFRGLDHALLYFGINATSHLSAIWLACIVFILLFSTYWSLFRAKLDASKFFIATCMILLIPTISPNYRLLFMYPSLWYLCDSIVFTSAKLKKMFIITSAFLLAISPIYYFGSTGLNVGQSVKPILIITLLMIVFFSDGYKRNRLSNQNLDKDAAYK